MPARSAQQLEKLFDAKPVIVLKEMQTALDSASRATIFRLLVKVSYCRSYNRNGMYYTKHDPTRYDKHLARCKVAGQFIYLHSDSEIRMEQLTKRRELLEQRRFELKEVTDAVVIQVLLILIRHPGSRTVDVARRLKGHSPPITIQHVRVVFDRYDLGNVGKKGEPSRH